MEITTLKQFDLKHLKKNMPNLDDPEDGVVRVFDNRIFVGKKEVKHYCQFPFQVMDMARKIAGYNPNECDDDSFPILI